MGEKLRWLRGEAAKDDCTTVSEVHMKPEYVQIETPYCSQARAFERWQEMADMFPAFHNVRRFGDDKGLVPTQDVASRERLAP